jgi:hypothetical protein
VARVTVIHAVPAPSASVEIVERTLLPFDFTRFKVTPRSIPPITTLPVEQLVAGLAEEYVYAQLCEEVMLSFAAENEARMVAMIAARRKRGTHGGDDRRPQQCRAQARRARRELSPAAPRRNHQRDHRTICRQHAVGGQEEARGAVNLTKQPGGADEGGSTHCGGG